MSAHPYREASALAAPVRRPPWHRPLAALTPGFVGARWQWYRRATGGRWAVMWKRHYYNVPWAPLGWRRVPECPFKTFGVVANGTRGECDATECRCEVWP